MSAPAGPAGAVVTVVGLDGATLPTQAQEAVAAATVLLGGSHLLAAVPGAAGRARAVDDARLLVAEVTAAQERGETVVVLADGDPGFFGVVRHLTRARLPLCVLPARSSLALAFGRLGLPWDDAIVVSAHGRPRRTALNVLRRFGSSGQPVAVLTDADSAPDRLVEELGDECPQLAVLERLGEPDETLTWVVPGGWANPPAGVISATRARTRSWATPNLVISPGRPTHEEHPVLVGRRASVDDPARDWALPDDAFTTGEAMLPREVRALVLARLAPGLGRLVWDVGAGCGAVAVECSRLGAAAVAVERDPRALHLIETNAATLRAPVRLVHGAAPEALVGLPEPDAVFVGGGGPEVVAACAKAAPQRLVVAFRSPRGGRPDAGGPGGLRRRHRDAPGPAAGAGLARAPSRRGLAGRGGQRRAAVTRPPTP